MRIILTAKCAKFLLLMALINAKNAKLCELFFHKIFNDKNFACFAIKSVRTKLTFLQNSKLETNKKNLIIDFA